MAAAIIKESVEHELRRAEQAAIRASRSAPGCATACSPGRVRTISKCPTASKQWHTGLFCGPSFLLIILGLVSGCQRAGSVSPGDDRSPVSARAEGQQPWFVDITAETG